MHDYTETLESGNWLIKISPTTEYGYFENQDTGGEGGLWFTGNELYDYDGMFELPKLVADALQGAGYVVPREFLYMLDEEDFDDSGD
jgi:hypothetical protein